MKSTWTKGLEEDQHEGIRNAFNAASVVRSRLTEICIDKIDTIMTTHKRQYDSPAWAYEQADAVGYRRALEEIISLLGK